MGTKQLILLAFLLLISQIARAQENRLIPIPEANYHYISNLQHHGYLLNLNPTSLPYTEKEVSRGLRRINRSSLTKQERHWVDLVKKSLRLRKKDRHRLKYGMDIRAGSYLGNSRRESMLRPLGNKPFAYPFIYLSGYMEHGKLVANFGLDHNLYYDRDPDGLDAVTRLYTRSENAYLGFNGKWVKVYFGRFKNQWGPYGGTSTILSSNPDSYDQLNLRFGNNKFSMRAVLGALDNMSADSTYTGNDKSLGSRRRFIVAHRFDWRPNHHVGITVFESILYSGVNSGISLKYFNPLHVYAFLDNAPKNDDMNLMIGSMTWLHWNGLTLSAQLALDDIQVQKSVEKNSFAFSTSLYQANLFHNVDLGLHFEAVSAQAYVSHFPQGRYVYLKRGLATQFNDYVLGALYTHIYTGSFAFTPRLQLLLQGEQHINQLQVFRYPNGRPIPYILTGNQSRTVRPSFTFRYQPFVAFWIKGNAGVNFVRDYHNQPGVDKTRFSGMLKFGINFSLFSK